MTDPIPAATLVLMRPAAAGPPELLMIERAQTMAFAAGALVFPGGRIDPGDHRAAAALGADFGDAAARIAAIRETVEETGIAAALSPCPEATVTVALREGLAAGEPFEHLLQCHGLRIDLAALTPFARWCPTFHETRRFDATFYLAEAAADCGEGSADAAEATRVLWAGANAILADIANGAAHAIFPTRRNLERLACFASIDEALVDAERRPVRKIIPWVEQRGGEDWLCIPEDAGYPITAEPLTTARRG